MLIVDRFEGDYAIVEQDGNGFLNLPRDRLPNNVRPGDCLIFENEHYRIDVEQTRKRREEMNKLLRSLKKG